jgi:hypothetical protein
MMHKGRGCEVFSKSRVREERKSVDPEHEKRQEGKR